MMVKTELIQYNTWCSQNTDDTNVLQKKQSDRSSGNYFGIILIYAMIACSSNINCTVEGIFISLLRSMNCSQYAQVANMTVVYWCTGVHRSIPMGQKKHSEHLRMKDSFAAVYFTLKFPLIPSCKPRICPASNKT